MKNLNISIEEQLRELEVTCGWEWPMSILNSITILHIESE